MTVKGQQLLSTSGTPSHFLSTKPLASPPSGPKTLLLNLLPSHSYSQTLNPLEPPIVTAMGGRVSKPTSDEPQLYAVATPHPTLQYIYPVYAAPVDLPQVEDKRRKRSASVPSSWGRSEKSKKKRKIRVIGEAEASAYLSPVQSEDGAWYCYRESRPSAINLITRRHRLFFSIRY